MESSRRSFLQSSIAAACAAALLQSRWQKAFALTPSDSLWLLAAKGKAPSAGTVFEAAAIDPGFVVAYNPETQVTKKVAISFFGHDVSPNPKEKHLVFTTVKWGKKAALVDLKNEKLLQEIEAPKGMRFFGHSAWSPDGDRLFLSAQNDQTFTGAMLVYQVRDLQLKSVWETGGRFPHHAILHEPNELVVVNNRMLDAEISCLSFLDTTTGKLNRQISLAKQGFTHIGVDKRHSSFYSGGYISNEKDVRGATVFNHVKDGKGTFIQIPSIDDKAVSGDVLSLTVSGLNPSLMALAIHESNYLILLDLETGKYIYQGMPIRGPKGIQFSSTKKDTLYVNGLSGELSTFEFEVGGNGKMVLKAVAQRDFGNGSHITSTFI